MAAPPSSKRLRQPSVIEECAATRQADTGGRPDGLTAGEMERHGGKLKPELLRWGEDAQPSQQHHHANKRADEIAASAVFLMFFV